MDTGGRAPSKVRTVMITVLVAIAYYFGASLGLSLSTLPEQIATLWPPNAIILTALLLTERRRWWIYFLIMTLPYLYGDLNTAYSVQRSFVFYTANCTEVLVAALALKHFVGDSLKFDQLRGMALFLIWGVLIAPLISAFIASTTSLAEPDLAYWQAWRVWFLGDALGQLTLTPVIVLWASAGFVWTRDISINRLVEGLSLGLCVMLVAYFSLGANIGAASNFPALLYSPLPVFLWAATRFGPRGISSAILVTSLLAIWHAINGRGPFMANTPADNVLSLQLFLIAVSVPTMLLGALWAERRRLYEKSFLSEQCLRLTREQAPLARAAREHDQREILDAIIDAVITIDETGSIGSFNKSAEMLFGYRAAEIVGKNVALLMPDPDASKHDGYLRNYVESGVARIIGYGREVEGQRKNKTRFPMRLSIAKLSADESGRRRFIGTCHDLTLVKKQEDHLRAAEKMDALGRLTGGIAHDFNNMLGVVTGYADLLEGMLAGEPKLARYAHEIHDAGERGAQLTKKLMSFSRQEPVGAEKLDINEILRKQQDMLQKTLTVRISLLLDLTDDVWPVRLDASDLEDAIVNLSINAMHAMQNTAIDARLTIRTRNKSLDTIGAVAVGLVSGDYVQLSLSDTGEGMTDTIRERIFDPFFTTNGENGTGLGLSQVFSFVKRAGGAIQVYSELGHGSEFTLYFPHSLEDEIQHGVGATEVDYDFPGTENILVVDDEAALRALTATLLRQRGYRVFCAEDGQQALKILEREDIDLMISDLIMPGMGGYQLAAQVQEKYPAIKIQLASGLDNSWNMGTVDESLRQNLLHKPFDSQALIKQIRELLDD